MSVRADPRLTDRQRAVLERIDRRVPIKVIAGELGVSEARINQHIRALKDKFEVESMSELVEQFRARSNLKKGSNSNVCDDQQQEGQPLEDPYRNPSSRKSQLHDAPIFPDQRGRVDPGEIVLSDAHHVLIDAPWIGPREPAVVPAALDGDNAILYRLAVMVGIAFGIVAAVILIVTASLSLSTMMADKADVRTDQSGRSY